MMRITIFYMFAFIVECFCGEDPEREIQTYTVSADQNFQFNGSTSSTNISEMEFETTVRTNEEENDNCTLTKHESFCNCSELVGLIPEDYTMINGSAYVAALNKTYNESFYEFIDGYLAICIEKKNNQSKASKDRNDSAVRISLHYITLIGLILSLMGLLLYLVAFIIVPKMKDMPGCCLASLCASMLIGYLSFLLGSTEGIKSVLAACVASASISYFFILSSLLWMNVKAFSIYIALYNSTSKLRSTSTSFSCKRFCKSAAYAWGISALFATAALICDNLDGVPITYQPLFARDLCWFNQLPAIRIFFIGPAFVIIGVNAVLFGLSVYTIYSNRMEALTDSQVSQTQTYFATYYKLALIMGVLWLSGILARLTDNIVLWYVFALSNSLQGFFIFLAFTYSDLRRYVSTKLMPAAKGFPKAGSVAIGKKISMEDTTRRTSAEMSA